MNTTLLAVPAWSYRAAARAAFLGLALLLAVTITGCGKKSDPEAVKAFNKLMDDYSALLDRYEADLKKLHAAGDIEAVKTKQADLVKAQAAWHQQWLAQVDKNSLIDDETGKSIAARATILRNRTADALKDPNPAAAPKKSEGGTPAPAGDAQSGKAAPAKEAPAGGEATAPEPTAGADAKIPEAPAAPAAPPAAAPKNE